MRKLQIIAIINLLILAGCKNTENRLLSQGSENWSGTTKLREEWKTYLKDVDTLTYITSYYPNGKLKSKVIMKNDGLWQIEAVLDTSGNKKNFGAFKNGNGYVIQFEGESGNPEYEGLYVNGNKEDWWKTYHYSGYIIDSSLYKEGYDQTEYGDNALIKLLDSYGPLKNNLYR